MKMKKSVLALGALALTASLALATPAQAASLLLYKTVTTTGARAVVTKQTSGKVILTALDTRVDGKSGIARLKFSNGNSAIVNASGGNRTAAGIDFRVSKGTRVQLQACTANMSKGPQLTGCTSTPWFTMN